MAKRNYTSAVAAALAAALMLSGCVVTPYGVRPMGPDVYVGASIAVAPPPAPVEYVGVAPALGYVWMGGYWNWVGGRHVWVAGHWGPGRPGFRWVAAHWARGGGGWRLAQGHWAR